MHAPQRSGLYRRFVRTVNEARLPAAPADETVVSVDHLAELPEVVQRYLRFMGVVGRPRDWSFRARFTGRFRLRPRLRWMPAEAWQYNTRVGVARIFVMQLRAAGVLPMTGSDTYLQGRGRMLGKLLDRIVVADGQGPEFDVGELTTYLNGCNSCRAVNAARPAYRMDRRGRRELRRAPDRRRHSVTARVFVDERGAPYDFSTTDRFADLPGGPVRAEWRTPVRGWEHLDGRAVPGPMEAVWHLPDGPLRYVTGRLTAIAWNVPPEPG
jgi:hypothetical protein